MKIEILLSVYNGEKYLKSQIESIINQTNIDWFLTIRDDFSTDNSLNIIEEFCNKYHNRIHLLTDNLGNIGAINSFYELLKNSVGEYIMFCDQDDVWFKNKIDFSMQKISEKEQIQGKETAILFFTDQQVVDENLNLISDSFFRYSNIIFKPNPKFYDIAVRNSVSGCTILMNRSAVSIVKPVTEKTEMHDIWIALSVAKNGYLYGSPQKTMMYRQHSNNSIGAKKYDKISLKASKIVKHYQLNKQRYECVKAIDSSFNIFKYLLFKSLYFLKKSKQ